MNINKILNSIDEGLKKSLIDFGNSKVQKYHSVDTGDIQFMIDKINEWIGLQNNKDLSENDKIMPSDLLNKLCKSKYIGIFLVYDYLQFLNIIGNIMPSEIDNVVNLNWMDVSLLDFSSFFINWHTKTTKGILDIRYWDMWQIPDRAFHSTYFTSVILPSTIIAIKSGAFLGCVFLTDLNIPDGVNYISDVVFYNCESLKKISIPDSVTEIGNHAFSHCTQLETVNLPKYLTSLGLCAFLDSGIKTINIPSTLTLLDFKVFSECNNLINITIPGNIRWIGFNAFEGCRSLKKVVFEEGSNMLIIYEMAFKNCISLSSVYLPSNVLLLGNYIFSGCNNLTCINYAGTKLEWSHIRKLAKWKCKSAISKINCADGIIIVKNKTI